MPNHVQNVLQISGPDAFSAIRKYIVTTTDEDTQKPYTRFDFETLIPMPAACRGATEDSLSPDVLAILTQGGDIVASWNHLRNFDRQNKLGHWRGLFDYERGEIERLVEGAFPGSIARATAMALCIGETGFRSWYDWSIVNWGTKWNSYDFVESGSGDQIELRFDTAWNVPLPVLEALAKAEPTLAFKHFAFDEGWNFCARGNAAEGVFSIETIRSPGREDQRVIETHRVCYGIDPEAEEDEDAA